MLREKRFSIHILAIRENANKQMARDEFAGISVDDVDGLICPVDFGLFARFAVDAHRRTRFLREYLVMKTELRVLQRNFVSCSAMVAVLLPKQTQCDSVFRHFAMNVLLIRVLAR